MTVDDHDPLLTALRQTLHDPARLLTPPQDPVRWVRRGVRRRRARQVLALLTVLAVMSAGLAVAVASGRDHRTQQLATQPAPAAVPQPASYFAHLPTGTAAPGAIQEVDARTGNVLRAFGQAYDPYLMGGFTVDPGHQHLYYTTLNEPAQTFDIIDQPVSGAPSVVLGQGSALRLSPDGRWLAYLTTPAPIALATAITVRDLASGQQRTLALPLPAQTAQLVWLADSRLLLLQRPLQPAASCPGVVICAYPDIPLDRTTHLYRFDPRSDAGWTGVSAATGTVTDPEPAPATWWTYDLLAPAPTADHVRVTDEAGGYTTTSVLTVRLQDGTPTDDLTLPAGAQAEGVDASGQHLLFTTSTIPSLSSSLPEGTYTLDKDGQQQRLGPATAEAAW